MVFSTALLRQVASHYKDGEITLLASPRGGGILEGDGDVARTILYDKAGEERGLAALWNLGSRLRKEAFDIVISPHRSFRSALLARLSGAPLRVGFADAWSRWAWNAAVPFPAGEKVPWQRELLLMKAIGGEGKGRGT